MIDQRDVKNTFHRSFLKKKREDMKESKRVSMSCTLKSPHPLEASCPCKHVIVIRFNARVSLRRDQIDKKRTRR